jgi:hypothetical protein
VGAQTAAKREAETASTQNLEFGARGTIQIVDSFGEVKVEGWDREEVELTVTKRTQKKYEPKDLAKAVKELERVNVTVDRLSENSMLVINTRFPSRTPSRLMRGKTNLNLKYLVKVPSGCVLMIKHDIGEVEITNVSGDIEAVARIGDITLRLPETQDYAVDARVRIGDVSSEFGPDAKRQGVLSVGAKLAGEPAPPARRIFLRLGIGDITVGKLSAAKPGGQPGKHADGQASGQAGEQEGKNPPSQSAPSVLLTEGAQTGAAAEPQKEFHWR